MSLSRVVRDSILNQLILFLDRARYFVLRRILSIAFFLKIYKNRGLRIFVLSLISIALSFCLAITIPYPILFIGPLLFGFPHLLANYIFLPRFFSKEVLNGRLHVKFSSDRYLIGICLFFSAFYKVFLEKILINKITQFIPLVEIIVTTAIILWVAKKQKFWSRQTILSSFEIVVFIITIWFYPFQILAFLILAHNFQAFVFWIVAAKNNRHMIYPLISSLLFVFICSLIGLGCFDTWYLKISAKLNIDFFSLQYQVVPINLNDFYLMRVVIAAAFGQGVHYFIWLQAIPSELRVEPVPITLRKSLKRLVGTIGPSLPSMMIFVSLCFIGIAFVKPDLAHSLYLCVASGHGFLELGVAFTIMNRFLIGD